MKLKHKKISREEWQGDIGRAVTYLLDMLEVEESDEKLWEELCDVLETKLEAVMDIPDYNYN